MRCPARLHTGALSLGDRSCQLEAGHLLDHQATGLSEDQTIFWLDGDRRYFTGEFHPCAPSPCILPAGHHGSHSS